MDRTTVRVHHEKVKDHLMNISTIIKSPVPRAGKITPPYSSARGEGFTKIRRPSRTVTGFVTGIAMGLAMAGGQLSAGEDDLAFGKTLYHGKGGCVTCHGDRGRGDGPVAAGLDPKPRSFAEENFLYDTDGDGKKGTRADIRNVIAKGTAEFGGSPQMPPRPDLTREERSALADFVLSLSDESE